MLLLDPNKKKIINILFWILPLSFIAGNPLINLNVFFLIIFSVFFYFKEIIKIEINIYDKFLILFFFVLFFSSLFNSYFYFQESSIYFKEIFIKNFLFLRFLLIYFIIRFLVINKILNLKFFFISAAVCSLFVSLDVILQFLTGKDVFGYEGFQRRYPGPFGDEAISGSYLQRFSLFIFFLVPVFFSKSNNKIHIILASFVFFLIFFAILVSGNKIPFSMFILSILLLLFILIRSKKLIFFTLTLSFFTFMIIYKTNIEVQKNFGGFYKQILRSQMYISSVINNFKEETEIIIPNAWTKEIHNGFLAFGEKKITGGGIKSYKVSCPKVSKYPCGPHPHNYHIEILVAVGLVGYFFLLVLYLKFLYKFLIKNFLINHNKEQILSVLFSILFLLEFFPLKTTGSFFSTANATYLFIIMAIAISLDLKFENKKL